MTKSSDTAGVIAPPPLLALAAVVAGLGLDRLAPLGLPAMLPPLPRYALAAALFALTALVSLRAVRAFGRAGTEVKPWRPSTALVTSDIFAHTRNPMYWGLGLLILAIAIGLASAWTLIALAVFALVIHFGVVLREERYLEAKFGDAYRRYKTEVPRYGWRF
ncbi:MAG: isoprenylcysteine carboxylmethyltransferase family protein [Sulfuricaulis sp.]|nr:isoprenylcysteine carboxylmethyltransferase family protein [Sulfuricaulis sp.]